jgi:parallel beta-helix repeat protein
MALSRLPAPSTPSPVPVPHRTLRRTAVAGIAVPLALLATSCTGPAASGGEDTAVTTSAHDAGTTSGRAGVVCGRPSLDGPATPPPGAKVVRHHSLARVAKRSRPGAVIWIAPGVHTLGHGQYDSVIPRPHQVFIGAPGAILDGQHSNLYAFTGSARRVTVSHLTIQNFGEPKDNVNQGVVNHDAARGWQIRHNTIRDVAGAAVFLGNDTRVLDNCITSNGQYGFSSYRKHGVHHVTLRGNEISNNNTADWEHRWPNCGCTGGGKFWDTTDVDVVDNWFHGNHGPALWADTNNSGFLIKGNTFSHNDAQGIFYEISYNARIVHNRFVGNDWVEGLANQGFPGSAIYLSESGSDPRAGQRFGHRFLVAHNTFVDNWGGIMAWENPDRFAGSPANSSSGYTTLVDPRVATLKACHTPVLIKQEPYFDACRWKVQNLQVSHNRFTTDPSQIPSCAVAKLCGFMGLVSNYGSYPSWSPYKRYIVPNNITFHQANSWTDNSYTGPWHFMIHTLGHRVSWQGWRGAKYGQDADSISE